MKPDEIKPALVFLEGVVVKMLQLWMLMLNFLGLTPHDRQYST